MDERIPQPPPTTQPPPVRAPDLAHVPPSSSGAAGALAALLTPEHEPLTFHRPDPMDLLWAVGWVRLSVLAVLLTLCFSPVFLPRHLATPLVFTGWKVYVITIGLGIEAVVHATRAVLAARHEPFCIHCGYSLQDRPEGSPCPECGRPFLHIAIVEYRRDPAWFAERLKIIRRQMPPPQESRGLGAPQIVHEQPASNASTNEPKS